MNLEGDRIKKSPKIFIELNGGGTPPTWKLVAALIRDLPITTLNGKLRRPGPVIGADQRGTKHLGSVENLVQKT